MRIDAEELARMDAFATKDPHISVCIQALISRVVSGDPVVERDSVKLEHELLEQKHHWVQFAKKALRHILVVGFFAWGAVRRRGKVFPKVLDLGTYALEGEDEFPFHLSLSGGPRGVLLASGFGYDPTFEGHLRSLCYRARTMCLYAKEMRIDSMQMDKKRLRPQFFAEVQDRKAEIEGIDFDWYAEGDRFERSDAEVLDLLQKRKMLLGEKEEGQVTVLPRGQKLVTVNPAQARSDLANMLRNTETAIFSIFSVPRHMFDVPSNVRATHEAPQYFYDQCSQLGDTLKMCLSEVFHGVYAKEIKELARGGKEVIDLKTSVYFVQTSRAELGDLRQLFEEGVLPWDVYAQHALRKVGIRSRIPEQGKRIKLS